MLQIIQRSFIYTSILLLANNHIFFSDYFNLYALENVKNIESFFKRNKVLDPFTIPETIFYDGSAQKFKLNDFRNNFIILNFWASWCLECVQNLKTLETFAEKLKDKDIQDIYIIPISVDFKNIEKLKDLYAKYNINLLGLFFDPKKELMINMEVNAPPKVILIDKNGFVKYKFNEVINWVDESIFDQLLKIKDIIDDKKTFTSTSRDKKRFFNNGISSDKKVTIIR